MSQSNQFHELGYEHYLKAPKRPPAHPPKGESLRAGTGFSFIDKLQSPMVATGALLAAGVIFAGVIIATYPSSQDEQQAVPIVKADLRPIREVPQDRGGMSIPHRDSTVLAQVGQVPQANNSQQERIENLLSPRSPESLMSKEDAINNAMTSSPMASGMDQEVAGDSAVGAVQEKSIGDKVLMQPKALLPEISSEAGMENKAENPDDKLSVNAVRESFEKPIKITEPKPQPGNILQKIGSSESDTSTPSGFERKVASAATSEKPAFKQKTAQAPASTPVEQSGETIDYVRSVLSQGGVEQLSGEDEKLNVIEPAVGAATSAPAAIESGIYYVQLASITDQTRAAKEWSKMKASYSSLAPAEYRVQKASLPSGTFYRIQAGPMSKTSAEEICDSLKAAGKPGGCLVVK